MITDPRIQQEGRISASFAAGERESRTSHAKIRVVIR
jgi:hypothetical protein